MNVCVSPQVHFFLKKLVNFLVCVYKKEKIIYGCTFYWSNLVYIEYDLKKYMRRLHSVKKTHFMLIVSLGLVEIGPYTSSESRMLYKVSFYYRKKSVLFDI